MAFLSSVEKDSIATTRDSFKDCILACKMYTNFEERQIGQAVSGKFAQNMFCTIFVPLSVAKILEKHIRSSSYLV